VAVGVDLVHHEPDLGHALAAHPSCHPNAFPDARRRRGCTDGARLADVVRAVRLRAAVEAVPLDRAGESLPVRDPPDLDLLARLQALARNVLAHDEGALAAELPPLA